MSRPNGVVRDDQRNRNGVRGIELGDTGHRDDQQRIGDRAGRNKVRGKGRVHGYGGPHESLDCDDIGHYKSYRGNGTGSYESRLRATKKKSKGIFNGLQDTIRDLKKNAMGIVKGNDNSRKYHEHLDLSNSL